MPAGDNVAARRSPNPRKTVAGACWFPEELTTQVLSRLPTASSIHRFRCVSKSWGRLLSDPDFIRRILFDETTGNSHHHHHHDEARRILVMRNEDRRTLYSVLSFNALQPLISAPTSSSTELLYDSPRIVGCCNGIFCIYDHSYGITLWNPTTAETKILPRLYPRCKVGFGFDPKTNDYKVVVIASSLSEGTVFPAVYSLRKDSWRKITNTAGAGALYNDGYRAINQSHDDPLTDKCYWFTCRDNMFSSLTCFDMTEEVFESAWFRNPPGTSRYDYPPGMARCYGKAFSMVKDALVAVYLRYTKGEVYRSCNEVWVSMDFRVDGNGCGWTKYFTVAASAPPLCGYFHLPALFGPRGKYFVVDGGGGLRVFDVETTAMDDVGISGEGFSFQVVSYVPSMLSLSDATVCGDLPVTSEVPSNHSLSDPTVRCNPPVIGDIGARSIWFIRGSRVATNLLKWIRQLFWSVLDFGVRIRQRLG